ncbi:MAG: T9SS type A sorting domain-containing protein [Bacteroidia bacterium]
MRNIFKTCFTALVLILALGFMQEAKATHLAGATITYNNLFGGSPPLGNFYQIDVKWVRDCGGVNLGIPNIMVRGCGFSTTITPTCLSGVTITPICAGVSCANPGSNIVYEEIHCTGNVFLPSTPCANYVFSAVRGERNFAIQTILNPGSQDLYVEARLNNTVGNHSSPVFGALPITTICVGQPFSFNNQVQSTNGGTLTYSLVKPKTGANAWVSYLPGFSFTSPYQGTFNLNPTNGAITGTPTAPTVTIFAINVTETDANGNVISTVRRDIQLNIIPCSNTPPTVSPGTLTGKACVGELYTEVFTGSDLDGDFITMSWGNEIAGAVFSVSNNGTTSPTGTFSWLPTLNDLGLHSFTVTVQDDGCPVNGANTYTYNVLVDSCCDEFVFDIVSCYPVETGKPVSAHGPPVLGNVSIDQGAMKASQQGGNSSDDKPETCYPCAQGYYDVSLDDKNGNFYDGYDKCLEIEWIEAGVVVSRQATFRADPDIRYTVRVTNICSGCSWEEDFWFCCEEVDPGFTITTECTPHDFRITVTSTSPVPNSRFYLHSAHSPCVTNNCLVDSDNPDQKLDGTTVTFIVPKSCGAYYMVKHAEWNHCEWKTVRQLVRDNCCEAPTNLRCDLLPGGPTLAWDTACNKINYQIEITGNDPFCCSHTFGSTLSYIQPVTGTTHRLPIIQGGYRCSSWRVRTECGPGEYSDWSPKQCICTDSKHLAPVHSGANFAEFSFISYPSPVANTLTVRGSAVVEGTTISLLDLSGKTIMSRKADGMGEREIDISALPNGIYYLRLEKEGLGSKTEKIIIQH